MSIGAAAALVAVSATGKEVTELSLGQPGRLRQLLRHPLRLLGVEGHCYVNQGPGFKDAGAKVARAMRGSKGSGVQEKAAAPIDTHRHQER